VITGSIGKGISILIGIGAHDTEREAQYLIDKVLHLRIFSDDAGKMNRSAIDVAAELLLVSQFTLYGDTRKGRRPSFDAAAQTRSRRQRFYDWIVTEMRKSGLKVRRLVRSRHIWMWNLVNDGPVTFLLES
jgi:D-tyrosyl-tRNA(Tyr) deacylase